jgi:hypothetical protein
MSVCPRGTAWLPLDGFSQNLVFQGLKICEERSSFINPLNAELNPICPLLALLGARPILHVSRIRVKI